MINKCHSNFILPIDTIQLSEQDRELVRIFLLRYRDIVFMREEQKILFSIEKTADLIGKSCCKVASVLVDCGLRASRRSFPQTFLDEIDTIAFRKQGRFTALERPAFDELVLFWQNMNENTFGWDQYHISIPDTAKVVNG